MAMMMSKNLHAGSTPRRGKKTLSLSITDKPVRPIYPIKSESERDRFISICEKFIRSSMEYREYMAFLKDKMDFNRCAVLSNVINGNGKKYSIEIHHEPFTLYDLVDIEIMRRETEHLPIEILPIAESVMCLHYVGIVGLIPLSKTQHELIHSSKCFIPLQHIYQDYDKYYEKFEEYIEEAEHIKKKLDVKIQLSLECSKIQSDSEPEYVYLNVDGFNFPEVPEEWKEAISKSRKDLAIAEKEEQKKQKTKTVDEEESKT